MSLFAAGVVLFLLLAATYSGRGFWIALASIMLSMAALIGFVFVATLQDPSQVKPRLAWVASKLPLVLDQKTADSIAKALAHLPGVQPCAQGQGAACGTAASAAVAADTVSTAAAGGQAEPPSTEQQSMQAAATPSWSAPPSPPKQETPTPSGPVAWLLDEQQPQGAADGGFAIDGKNASDQAMEEVHAVLKPDGGQREIELALNVAGEPASGGVIPPGARFSLGAPKGDASQQSGGAILTFRYSQSGQKRTSILYLTPAMISHLANRG
ncbi:MAG: hypothetical protein ACM3MH_05605 [Actinomycetota bacterium]